MVSRRTASWPNVQPGAVVGCGLADAGGSRKEPGAPELLQLPSLVQLQNVQSVGVGEAKQGGRGLVPLLNLSSLHEHSKVDAARPPLPLPPPAVKQTDVGTGPLTRPHTRSGTTVDGENMRSHVLPPPRKARNAALRA